MAKNQTKQQLSGTRRRPWRRVAGASAIAAGVVLLVGAAVVSWQTFHPEPLYRYELDVQTSAAAADETSNSPVLRKGNLVGVDSNRHLATFEIASSDSGPVLMKWTPRVDAPFLTLLPDYDEVAALADVLQRHVPASRPLMAWWDTTRQLQQFTAINAVFDQHLGQPLFIPAVWRPWSDKVRSTEQEFWNSSVTEIAESDQQRFREFADALLMDEHKGMAHLRKLAGGEKTVLVLHLRDVIMLGQMAPSKLGVAFREFPDSGDVHGTVSGVRDWLSRNEYSAYSVMRGGGHMFRAIALTDDVSAATLVARLLPFIGNDQHDVDGATLVYRTQGFMVYEIAPEAAMSAMAEVPQ